MTIIGWVLYGIAIVAAAVYGVSVPRSLVKGSRAEDTDMKLVQVLGASVGMIQLLLLAPVIYVTSMGILCRGHLLWMLPLWAISHPLTLMAHQVVASRGAAALARAFGFLVVAGGLTILQYFLSGEGSVWVSFRLGGIPIPLIGITFLVSLIAAHIVAVALAFLPLQAMFGIE